MDSVIITNLLVPQRLRTEKPKSHTFSYELLEISMRKSRVLEAYNDFYYLVGELPENIEIKSSLGSCGCRSARQTHEHHGEIFITNHSEEIKQLSFLVLTCQF